MAYKYLFNPERYLELIMKHDESRKTGQMLRDSELEEWLSYSTQFSDYLISKNKNDIIIVTKQFISYEVSAEEFIEQFLNLSKPDTKLFYKPSLESLQKVKIDPDFSSFSLMISNIIIESELYERYEQKLSEGEFRNLVNKEYERLLEFDSIIDIETEIDTDVPQLIQRSYNILVTSVILLLILIIYSLK